jgi:hypothetical protein
MQTLRQPHAATRTEGSRTQSGPGAQADGIMATLRASGGRITATRRATIEVLLGTGDHRHLNAEEVAAEVRARFPDVAESTIYRTLSAFEELGIVTHVHLGHGPSTGWPDGWTTNTASPSPENTSLSSASVKRAALVDRGSALGREPATDAQDLRRRAPQ